MFPLDSSEQQDNITMWAGHHNEAWSNLGQGEVSLPTAVG